MTKRSRNEYERDMKDFQTILSSVDNLRNGIIQTNLYSCFTNENSDGQQNNDLKNLENLIPVLVVVGDQSSGKSSLISSLSGIDLPVGVSRTTCFPIEIRFRQGTKEPVTYEFRTSGGVSSGLLTERTLNECQNAAVAAQVPGRSFFTDRLILHVSGDTPTYTLVDMPGLFQSATNEDKKDEETVRNMVRDEIKGENVVILHVLSLSGGDLANCSSRGLCNAVDPEKKRRITIFTKIDTCQDLEARLPFLREEMANSSGAFVYTRAFHNGTWSLVKEEDEMNHLKKYQSLHSFVLGRKALQEKLSDQLKGSILLNRDKILETCRTVRKKIDFLLKQIGGRESTRPWSSFDKWRHEIKVKKEEAMKGGEIRTNLLALYNNLHQVLPSTWNEDLVSLDIRNIQQEMDIQRGETCTFAIGSEACIRKFTGMMIDLLSPGLINWLKELEQIHRSYLSTVWFSNPNPNCQRAAKEYYRNSLDAFNAVNTSFQTKIEEQPKMISERPYLLHEGEVIRALLEHRTYALKHVLRLLNENKIDRIHSFISDEIEKKYTSLPLLEAEETKVKIIAYWKISVRNLHEQIVSSCRGFEMQIQAIIKDQFDLDPNLELFKETSEQKERREKLLQVEELNQTVITSFE